MEISTNNFKNTIAGILLAVVFVNTSIAQTNLFKPYAKFGFFGSFNSIGIGETKYNVPDAPILLTYSTYKAGSFGVNYRVFQKNNFVIKTGLYFNFYKDLINYEIDKGQLIGRDYGVSFSIGSNNIGNIALPLSVEYNTRIFKKVFISGFVTYSVAYMSVTESRGQDILANIEIIVDNPNRESEPFYNNVQVGGGFYFPAKFALFHLFAYYNKNFKDIMIAKYHITGVQDRTYTEMNGTMKQSGDYIGFGLVIYPKKWWK